jgi:predicted ATP-grasp superfamily ATP-dependent carboligase
MWPLRMTAPTEIPTPKGRTTPSGVPSDEPPPQALACVMGNMDLVRPLGIAGIPCAVIARPGSPTLYSRFTRTALYRDDSERTDELIEELVRFGAAQAAPPVLFYQEDSQVLLVSRYRARLAQAFRFVVASPDLVEDLVDKRRFHALSERLHLPVPRTRLVRPGAGSSPADVDMAFPVIVKPPMRGKSWDAIGGSGKVLLVDTAEELHELWPKLASSGMEFLVQELISGPENRIESYHVYVDSAGGIVGEFTGQKIRTYPVAYGHSTALTITDASDVREEGRKIVRALNLRGVAKLDFKRGPDGTLHLFEVNPRFNLWHHLGAIAGVNLPALVYGDLAGLPRPVVPRARAGVCWCKIWLDLPAARASGTPMRRWLPWVLGCEAKSAMAWDDPMPLLRGGLHRLWTKYSASRGSSQHHEQSSS